MARSTGSMSQRVGQQGVSPLVFMNCDGIAGSLQKRTDCQSQN